MDTVFQVFKYKLGFLHAFKYTTIFYNTFRYNAVLDITRFKDGSQKCIDYIEKWSFMVIFSIYSTHFCLDITRLIN